MASHTVRPSLCQAGQPPHTLPYGGCILPSVLPAGSVLLKTLKPARADTFKYAYIAGWLHDYEQRAAPELPAVCMRVVEVRCRPLPAPPPAVCHLPPAACRHRRRCQRIW
jgi:hypothetical protein